MSFTDFITNMIGINPRYEFIVQIMACVCFIICLDVVIRFIISGIEAIFYRGK